MLEIKKIIWVYIFAILFIVLNAYFLINEQYIFTLVPFGLLIIFFAIFSLDKLILTIVFLTPLSIPLKELIPGLDFNFFLPTEPLLAGILIIFIFKLILDKKFDKKILYHPLSILIYINIFWIFITSLTSTMPVVSFKFLIARMWFVATFYFIATQIFRNKKNIHKYYWLYIPSLIIVIAYTINRHLSYGLHDQEAANFVCNPFYSDHTSYGAVLAMLIPVIIGYLFLKNKSLLKKSFAWTALIILFTALILSYTRAAWVSLVAAMFVFIIMYLKIKFRLVFVVGVAFITLFLVFRTDIIIYLESNNQDSSANISKHLESISNISSDASNLERINRWQSAFRMFEERPVFGWGPGTYMFNYAPFQLSSEKTIISTNSGDMGNAHSEYIGPLSESGILGSLTFLLIAIFAIYTGVKVYSKAKEKEIKIMSLVITLGLFTYLVHGFLNNFLDTDKVSSLFWGFIAMLVAMDVYHTKDNKEENTKELE